MERVTRELAFLDDRWLVVLDRVRTRRDELEPRVLWHCPVVPQFDAATRSFSVEREGARVVVSALLPREVKMNWVEGFVSGGRQIEPVGTLKGLADMGVGRVEVTASAISSRDYLFVHMLDIADITDAQPKCSAEIDRDRISVRVGDRRVGFRLDRPGLLR